MSEFIERELGWDDEIEQDQKDWEPLPEGDYDFTVTAFERGRFEGSKKLPPCNKAVVTISIESPEYGTATIMHNLFLHTKTEGLLSAFFCSIGQKKHGEKLRMNWQAVIGSKGRCKVGIREWTNKNGEVIKSNEIKKFYESDTPASATPSFGSGKSFVPGKFGWN